MHLCMSSTQKGKAVLEKDLARARKMCRDLVDEGVKVNEEREQKMGNLNVGLLLLLPVAVTWDMLCIIVGNVCYVGKAGGVQATGCLIRGTPRAITGSEGGGA